MSMSKSSVMCAVALIALLGLRLMPVAQAEEQPPAITDRATGAGGVFTAPVSPRLIVELDSPPLAIVYRREVNAAAVNGRLDANSAAAQAYIQQLQAEQAVFVNHMRAVLTDVAVATFINEAGVSEEATYQLLFNGLSVNLGATVSGEVSEEARQILVKLPGVKNVYHDTPHYRQLYASTERINAPVLWNALGGRANAGAGIKVASMDGGVHHLAPMMNGNGYSYPSGYGPHGLGLTANNNGKIIVSRAYFRPWDPPAAGDENPWPGVNGTSHGMHTSSTAAGDLVTATYNGVNVGVISGVAPKAYVMSYRVFYASVNNDGAFYNTEGLAALEDIVRDGADVVNNSWGSGPSSTGGAFDALDQALINATKAGVFVAISNGNAGPGSGTSDHPSFDYINVAASTKAGVVDRIIGFSSRGPGVGGTLKPDIAAPGVNILAQGYTPNATGEARHLGYGQQSGTSMAAPHVAGAAALLQQAHPDWSVADVKSALMSTAQYMNVYLADGNTPAQPLDMGAGRLDLAQAADPGVILDPPSLSFGFVPTGTQTTLTVTVRSVAAAAETYQLSTLYTGDGFAPTKTTTLPGFSVNVPSLTLNPGESKRIAITFDPATAQAGLGDKQGYLIMAGATYDAHLPAWVRVMPAVPTADVLLIDGDFSTLGPAQMGVPFTDYRWYYTDALDQLPYTYSILDYNQSPALTSALPNAATLRGYKAIIYFTGDNYVNGAGLKPLDMDKLVEYSNAGGTVMVMGQDLAATIGHDKTDPSGAHFFYEARLGANWIQDSISQNQTPTALIAATTAAPAIFADLVIDLTQPRQRKASGPLSGTQEVPPVATGTKGDFSLFYDIDSNDSKFVVTVTPSTTQPITITDMRIYHGAEGAIGAAIRDLALLGNLPLPRLITDTLQISGLISPSFTLTEVQQLVNEGLYINVHTTVNPNGAIRGQLKPVALPNQAYVDELDNHPHDKPDSPVPGEKKYPSTALLTYQGSDNQYNGNVAIGYRAQPSLENPGITYYGRTLYTSFGLEGMNNRFNSTLGITPTTRSELLGTLLAWAWSPAATAVQISDTRAVSSTIYLFSATPAYDPQRNVRALFPQPVHYRWDFGDGSPYLISPESQASHQYLCRDTTIYTLRVEITDTYGNVVIGSKTLDVTNNCATDVGSTTTLYLPFVHR